MRRMKKLLECVVNFSEGRDKKKIDAIVKSVKSTRGVETLDLHSDIDHNRSVLTFTGEPMPLREAAFKLTKKCAEIIDIEKHDGQHPFIGAVDVIPFIPLKNAHMQDAAYCAVELGKRVWQELKIPVYLYGEASILDHRSSLPNVRRGGYNALKAEIASDERYPDIGKPILHPTAGAVAIGARDFLIAYNINLKTDDIHAAKEIAKQLRETHGGPRGVRAIGVYLKSRRIAQVSINITDHKEVSLKTLFDLVSDWARYRRIEVLESEIVGLLPKEAYFKDMQKAFKMHKEPKLI